MAERAVRISPDGGIVIDPAAWISRRVGGPRPDLTAELRAWPGRVTTDGIPNWPQVAQAWCTVRGHQVRGLGLIVHKQTRLDTQVWALLTTSDGRPLAVVGINHDPPTVHLDTTGDPWRWYDADSVVIACPGGHSWQWRSGREVLTAAGRPATLTTVFGPSLDAPFSICPDCTAFHLGSRKIPCDCDRSPWILCPTCGQRCGTGLPRP